MTASYGNILERGSGRMKRLLAASATALVLSATFAVPSWAAVKDTRSLEVDYSRDLVLLESYPQAGFKVDVLRDGVNIGTFSGNTGANGFMEINHGGAAAGDCWQGDFSPNILPGNKVVTTRVDANGNALGVDGNPASATNPADTDYTFVRDLTFTEDASGNLAGHGRGVENPDGTFDLDAPIDVSGGALIEAKRVQDNKQKFFADIIPDALNGGAFNTPIAGSGGEVTLQFVNPQGGDVEAGAVESTVAFPVGDEVRPADCPPVAESAMTSVSHEVINRSTLDQNESLTIGGVTHVDPQLGAVTVSSLTVGGHPYTVTISEDGRTWTATVPAADLQNAGLFPDGNIGISVSFAGPGAPQQAQTKTIQKDIIAPAITANHPSGSTHNGSVGVTLKSDGNEQIRYTTDGNPPFNENNTTLYNGQPINLSKTGTINAFAVDAAGNRSEASFSYTVRQATALTLSGPAALNFGQSATLSGKLSSGGAALANKPVILEQRAAGSSGAFTQVGAPKNTLADGGFSFAGIKPRANTEYRARFAQEAELQSKEISKQVKVRAIVSNNTATSNLKLGKVRNIVGKVSPVHAGKVVKVTVKRPGQPTLVRNLRLSNTSVYKFSYKPNKAGRYSVSVQFAGDADHLGGRSVLKSFRVIR